MYISQIDQSALGLSREYLTKGLSDKIVKAYYAYMVDMAVIYGADKSRAERELLDSLNFEIALANVSSLMSYTLIVSKQSIILNLNKYSHRFRYQMKNVVMPVLYTIHLLYVKYKKAIHICHGLNILMHYFQPI